MNHYEFSILLTIITTGPLAIFVLIKDRRPIIKQFALYTLTITNWAVCWYNLITSPSEEAALFWGRIIYFSAAFIPATFLHFTQNLLELHENKKHILVRRIVYFFSFIFVAISFHPKFVKGVKYFEGMGFYSSAGPYYFLYAIFFGSAVIWVLTLLIYAYPKETGLKKIQIAYAFVSYTIGYALSIYIFLPNYGYSLPKFPIYGIPLLHLILMYAIVRHRFMDMRILIRRASLFIGIYGILVACMLPLIFLIHKAFIESNYLLSSFTVLAILMVGATLSIGPFLYAYFIRRNSYFHETTLAGLTHELKSPLAAIESALELINSNIKSRTSSIYFEMIEKNSERLRKSVEDLLLVFNNQGLDLKLQRKEIDLSKLIIKICHSYQFLAETRQTRIRYLTNEKIKINCDPKGIEQVISNILSNAIKFSKESSIDVTCQAQKSQVTVSTQDFGSGIHQDDLPYIFDRFYQGRKNFNEKGSGIGLTIAKAWIDAHNGKIWAESDGEGKGTKIMFTLPLF